MNTTSNASPPAGNMVTNFSALLRTMRAVHEPSHALERFSACNVLPMDAAAGPADSTLTRESAPRLNASSPKAPVPANKSSTRVPSSSPHDSRCEKMASFVRSVVGRVPVCGAAISSPLNRPEMMRMAPLCRTGCRPKRPGGVGCNRFSETGGNAAIPGMDSGLRGMRRNR